MNQLVTENKFIEGIKQSILSGNKEFLRSFQIRLEIRERNSSNSSNQDNKNIVTTSIAYLAPPFQNIGFLETKWLEIIKGLVKYGNKNILKNVKLHLIMEERIQEENNNTKEATIRGSILDIKKEEKGRGITAVNHNTNNNRNNQSWFRPRDKFGRFTSAAAATTTR
jgi:hypothetical protein